MGFIVNPSRFGSGASFPHYAMQDGSNADVYDPGALATSGSFVVPATWNGRKVRVSAGSKSSAGSTSATITMAKGGSGFDGMGSGAYPGITSNPGGGTIHSAPIVVSTGDTFTMSGTVSGVNGNWKAFEVLPNSVRGALVNRITSGYSVGTGLTVVQWNNEVYDDGGWHDNSTNPSRMTQPSSGTGLVRVQANVSLAASGGELGLQIIRNGSALTADMQNDSTGNTLNIFSPPLAASTSDYFELRVRCSSATTVDVNNASWMSVNELPSSLKYAIDRITTNKSIPSGSSWNVFACDVEDADVGGWYTAGDNHFTVPSGVTQVRVGYFVRSSNTLGSTWCVGFFKNGSEFIEMPYNAQTNASVEMDHAVSGIIQVTAGDTLDFYARTAAGSMNAAAPSFLWIEEVPAVTS